MMRENWEIHWKDYYSILQIHPLAEPEVVKAAYLKLLTKYHPDHNLGKEPWANEKAKEITEAYEIISNSEKRGRYYVAYCHKTNPKPIITPPPKSETSKAKSNSETTNSSSPKPSHQPRSQEKAPPNENIKKDLTLDEQIALVFSLASHDKNIYFRRKDWERKVKEVKEWIKNYNCKYPLLYKGGVSGIGACPYCKQNYVLENKDASVRQCVNPICDYVLTPEYNWAEKPKDDSTQTKSGPTSYSRNNNVTRPEGSWRMGDLHTQKEVHQDSLSRAITAIFMLIAFGIPVSLWYVYARFNSNWWLLLCIPVSIICLPVAIILITQLFEKNKRKG
jgi:curved DNA-binding protein CbpA